MHRNVRNTLGRKGPSSSSGKRGMGATSRVRCRILYSLGNSAVLSIGRPVHWLHPLTLWNVLGFEKRCKILESTCQCSGHYWECNKTFPRFVITFLFHLPRPQDSFLALKLQGPGGASAWQQTVVLGRCGIFGASGDIRKVLGGGEGRGAQPWLFGRCVCELPAELAPGDCLTSFIRWMRGTAGQQVSRNHRRDDLSVTSDFNYTGLVKSCSKGTRERKQCHPKSTSSVLLRSGSSATEPRSHWAGR